MMSLFSYCNKADDRQCERLFSHPPSSKNYKLQVIHCSIYNYVSAT